MWMIQFDARGRFIRKAIYNVTLLALWQSQIPYGHVELVRYR